ncbi:MAG: aldehyde dehydrogenase family protein [Myxococcales bacterium]
MHEQRLAREQQWIGRTVRGSEGNPIADAVQGLRATFERERTRPYAWRRRQLQQLLELLRREEAQILEALALDLGKPRLEAYTAEIGDTAAGIRYLLKHLKSWLKPVRTSSGLAGFPGKSFVQAEPLGVVLVIAPWNYPFSSVVAPLAGALAAGNCVLAKPSEVAAATSQLLARLLPKYLDPEAVKVIEGGVPETTQLLALRFDHIFYTGNGQVGRVVMAAAAKHLTPVTLELGGKSPCIVDAEANLEIAAKRVVWAKFYNCGQTCVAPDYLLAHQDVYERLLPLLARTIREFWGANPQLSDDFGRIVNARHHQRLMTLMRGAGRILVGGQASEQERYIAPTLLVDVPEHAPLMQEEIFGPLLPILPVASLEHAISFVNQRPKPLALYLFSSDRRAAEHVRARTCSGGLVINHALVHLSVHSLPFGGVGESGMGAFHGKYSFDTFSHQRAVLQKPTFLETDLLYPPYTAQKESWIRRFL